jgi:cell division GTPase FtsZ
MGVNSLLEAIDSPSAITIAVSVRRGTKAGATYQLLAESGLDASRGQGGTLIL